MAFDAHLEALKRKHMAVSDAVEEAQRAPGIDDLKDPTTVRSWCSTTTAVCDVLRRGAATDLMGRSTTRPQPGRSRSCSARGRCGGRLRKTQEQKMQVSQVRGEEERGLLQHPTPTSRAGRGASRGCE